MSLEDIAMIRALPNVAVINPADAVEADQAVEYLVEHEGPAFLRLTRQKVDDVNGAGYRFEFGKAVQLREGTDVALVATGATVAEAVKAAEDLNRDGISARVLNVHTIHPLDEEAVLAAASDCRAIVTVEDHSVRGGLGGAVAEMLTQGDGGARLHVIGLRTFGESGTSDELYEKYGLAGDRIAETTRSFLENLS
jgi:transketolase